MGPRRSGKKGLIAYDAKMVDDLCTKFEKAWKKLKDNQNNIVRRGAAERDMLKISTEIRELLDSAVGGNKEQLEDVFGGACRRFHRLNNVVLQVEFSPANEKSSQ